MDGVWTVVGKWKRKCPCRSHLRSRKYLRVYRLMYGLWIVGRYLIPLVRPFKNKEADELEISIVGRGKGLNSSWLRDDQWISFDCPNAVKTSRSIILPPAVQCLPSLVDVRRMTTCPDLTNANPSLYFLLAFRWHVLSLDFWIRKSVRLQRLA